MPVLRCSRDTAVRSRGFRTSPGPPTLLRSESRDNEGRRRGFRRSPPRLSREGCERIVEAGRGKVEAGLGMPEAGRGSFDRRGMALMRFWEDSSMAMASQCSVFGSVAPQTQAGILSWGRWLTGQRRNSARIPTRGGLRNVVRAGDGGASAVCLSVGGWTGHQLQATGTSQFSRRELETNATARA